MKDILDFLPLFEKDRTFSITLTMKQWTKGKRLDDIEASINLKHFINRLNKSYFGNASKRFNKSVRFFATLEKSFSGRWHYHLCLETPALESVQELTNRIILCWSKTYFADKQIDVQSAYDIPGWLSYINKRGSSIDWNNYSC